MRYVSESILWTHQTRRMPQRGDTLGEQIKGGNVETFDDPLSEVYIKYITNNKTVHELACGLTYYNYQGNHFRVFSDMFSALLFTEGAHIQALADFTIESEMDAWILWYIHKNKECRNGIKF